MKRYRDAPEKKKLQTKQQLREPTDKIQDNPGMKGWQIRLPGIEEGWEMKLRTETPEIHSPTHL